MKRRLLVIKQVEDEGPGLIERVFVANGWDVQIVELIRGESLPLDFDHVGAVVILGGPMNVYEEEAYKFLRQEEQYIRRALIEEIPLLGICLGAQLLAKTCGARVKKAVRKEIGWFSVKKTTEGKIDALLGKNPEYLQVFQWHEDTFDIPEGAVLLATGDDCRNQAFRVGQNAYGLQFHIEVTEAMIKSWIQSDHGILRKTILRDTKIVKKRYKKEADRIISNFVGIAETSLKLRNVIELFTDEPKEAKRKVPVARGKRKRPVPP
ncbi:MAG TPA: type 1 glutamine amidotransferase [Syntrophorhabdaceae bacterium]|nr:type 1 glutamine amidotransferase [Syntrophorhabdaceae bacterium]